MIIYAITNTANGKRYVGMTIHTLADRWSKHKYSAAKGSKLAIHSAMRKYGLSNFLIEQVASLIVDDERALGELERYVIAQEKTLVPNGYNLTEGGEFAATTRGKPSAKKGSKWTPEQRAVMEAYWADPANREKSSKALTGIKKTKTRKGFKLSDEHRAKLKAAWAKNPERRAAQAQANVEREWTAESRAKASAAMSTEEHKEILRERNRVMNQTPEHAARVSAGHAKSRAAVNPTTFELEI